MMYDPEGIGTGSPRLSWEIRSDERNIVQTAYQILVASSPEKLYKDEGDLWNSGKIESKSSSHSVVYSGSQLKSRSDAYWKVKVFTNKGESGWSKPGKFSVGLLSAGDWKAQWIGMDKTFPGDSLTMHARLAARYLRKEFTGAKEIKSAKIYISGLGLYELYINGDKIGEQVHAPVPTDYTKSVMYNTFDIAQYLNKGKNTIGVILGNGRFFNVRQNYKTHKIMTFGFPKLLLQLEIEYTDGTTQTIVSDKTWKISVNGPIIANNEWDGEEYDARKEMPGWNKNAFNDGKWLPVQSVKAAGGTITAQMTENMKIKESIKPLSIKHLQADTFIVDMGQNMVGWLQIKAKGSKGAQIKMRFAENIKKDGRLYVDNLRSAWCTDSYTLKGEGSEIWEPSFVYHGFRYVQITGYPGTPTIDDLTGKVIYDDMQTVGSFESSDDLLNKIYKNAYWGIRGNYKGIPLDCPQRDERQPWLGDRSTGCLGESFIFDNEKLYIKWMDDIRESQKEDGQLSDIAPPYYMIYYSDNMTWPGTYLQVGEMIYEQFGNAEPIIKHYPYMKKWMDYMKDKYMQNYIVTKDKYGDWCVPPESPEMIHSQDPNRKTDGTLIATAYYFHFLQLMQKFAKISGNEVDIPGYAALAENIRKAFNEKFYNEKEHFYGNNTVTSNLLPLAFGMIDKDKENAVFGQVTYKISVTDKLHLGTGVIGTQWLMRELTKRGCADLAYTIATQKTYPSWGYMVEEGATTIWELWNGNTANPRMNSQNHVMLLGDLIVWMYEDLAGIKTHKNQPGFKMLWMKPNPTETLTSVNASHHTPYGEVKSNWKLIDGIFTWNISIPPGTRANILIPAASVDGITESGNPVMKTEGLKFVRIEENRVNLEIGSGEYTFTCTYGEAENRWKKGVLVQEFICEKPSFPESHASTIAETKEGHLIASWFGGTKERNPDVCIWVSRRINDKWTEPQNVANGIVNDTLRYACWNPVLYQVPKGDLQLYYKVGPNVAGWKGKVITSKDGGITWSQPKDLPEGFIGPVKNKPVLLKDGTLICPSSTEGNGWKVHFETTKDFGKTWKMIGPINDGKEFNTIQPSVLTYPDGQLQILCRSKERAVIESWSKDNGKTWSQPAKTMLPNNNSGTDAVTMHDGRQLLVYNHVLPNDTLKNGKGPRTPLNVAVSEDGKTWYAALVLEDSPISQYSYPSVIQSKDGMIHIVYTWRRKAIKYVKVDPKQLIWSKIEDMEWPSLSEDSEIQVFNPNRYKVSLCDWMMLKRQKVGAMELASQLDADGLEIDMGGLGKRISFDNKFTDERFVHQFLSECNRVGIQFSSVAMSAFYGQSFAKRDNYEALIDECIATMKALGVKVAFLPMGNASDLVKEPELYPEVVKRLKIVAKKAEAAEVVIGIETNLPTAKEAKLIDEINSPSIKSYVNFSSIIKRNEDVVKALKTLGKDRIIQIHVSNTDGHWIQNDPQLDMPKIKETLDKMGWSGWLVVERSRDTTDVHNVKWNYGANARFLKLFFQK